MEKNDLKSDTASSEVWSIVVGTIDEDGMAVSAERKIEIAKRSYELLTKKYGIRPSDIILMHLCFQ